MKNRQTPIRKIAVAVALVAGSLLSTQAFAQTDTPAALSQAFRDAQGMASKGQHYPAAAMFFNVYTAEGQLTNQALGHVTEELVLAGFPNAASYFFIKTLESGNRQAIRRVLTHLPTMMDAVGGDILRPYVVRRTTEADYNAATRAHFFYFLAKDELLKGDPSKALQALSRVTSGAGILAQAAYLRGAAYAMVGQLDNSIASFKDCDRLADRISGRSKALKEEAFDLEARCKAGLARAYYQKGAHDQAEEAYDDIPKASFVWTDVLFEQAWNAFAKKDYNRALGKLVTYRSPSLGFVFNPEVEVLRAQSFFALCHYDDVEKTVREFESRYGDVGLQLKNFLVANDQNLGAFYNIAKQTYYRRLHTSDMLSRALNRFIRGPYFASQLVQEKAVSAELGRVQRIAQSKGYAKFGSFLQKVIGWRAKSVRLLGGLFVKNSMKDLYDSLLADVDKISFIKLETLNRAKLKLEKRAVMSEDEEGVMKRGASDVERREYQYFWSFNGEFWADELGDYVFALESQCGS